MVTRGAPGVQMASLSRSRPSSALIETGSGMPSAVRALRTRMSPTPPSMIWASMLAIHEPPWAPIGPKQWTRMPLSRERFARLPQVFSPHLNSHTRW